MDIKKLSMPPKHHFFGYYGINPWDCTTRYHLALETDFHTHRPVPEDIATVGLIDRETHQFIPYAKTTAFAAVSPTAPLANGKTITFDSVHEGSRQIYLVELPLSVK